jgi:hypothetical protein
MNVGRYLRGEDRHIGTARITHSERDITLAQHAELKRRVAHAQSARDLAHEADMRELRREQLRDDVGGDAEDYLGDPDEYDYE